MMLALAVLDLPITAKEHPVETEGGSYTLKAAGPMIVFHEQVQPADAPEEASPLLLSQHFFREDQRYQKIEGQKHERFVRNEFLPGVVYGTKVVLTNPTSNKFSVQLLLQIPNGAISLNKGIQTDTIPVQVAPYATQTVEALFYFPATGAFTHYPAAISAFGDFLAAAKVTKIEVVDELTEVDKSTWSWISQQGSENEVINFLRTENGREIKLADMAWRMKDKAFFERTTDLLRSQFYYDDTLWSYAIKHRSPTQLSEFLRHSKIAQQVGPYLETQVLSYNPIDRHRYQHLEYAPLINPRAHQIGAEATILNHRFLGQYQQFLRGLTYKPTLDDQDRLALTYYLALQDRIGSALSWLAQINPENVEAKLQYDYLSAYLGMYEKRFDHSRSIANRHAKHPVPRWRNKFLAILGQLDETGKPIDAQQRDQAMEQLAQSEPQCSFETEGNQITFTYEHLQTVTLHFYPMDIELLFSRNPFIQDQSAQFNFIQPALSREVKLPADQNRFNYEIPPQLQNANVMIEARSQAGTVNKAYYANNLNLRMIENYGQLQVDKPRIYVKVYARMHDGSVKFFKDGYTDFRGRFDYVSLNTTEIENTARFAILILSETDGALITEVAPPKR